MSATENKAFVRRYLDAINGKAKPPAVVDQFISEEDDLLKQHIAGYEAAFPHYTLVPEDIVAEGDKVVVRFTFSATYGGGFMDIPAAGRPRRGPFPVGGGRRTRSGVMPQETEFLRETRFRH